MARPNSVAAIKEKPCDYCKVSFAPKRSDIKRWQRAKYCSRNCVTGALRSVSGSWSDSSKTCSRCRTEKPLEEFHIRKESAHGRSRLCKPCGVAVSRERRAADPVGFAAVARRCYLNNQEHYSHLKFMSRFRQYGLTLDQFHAKVEAQDFQCAICGEEPVPTRGREDGFVIDHDHATGRVRGLLCATCNLGLGAFKDVAANARRAAAYLESHAVG